MVVIRTLWTDDTNLRDEEGRQRPICFFAADAQWAESRPDEFRQAAEEEEAAWCPDPKRVFTMDLEVPEEAVAEMMAPKPVVKATVRKTKGDP